MDRGGGLMGPEVLPMPNVRNNASAQETRRRLMAAAGEVFAERGLHEATTRQITDRAGVNMAAINYHFSDKHELYAAVIRQIVEEEAPLLVPPLLVGSSAPEQLRQFVRGFMHRLLAGGRESWKHMIFSRELAQPTACFDDILKAFAFPLLGLLRPVFRELLGEAAAAEEVEMHIASLLGQCLYYTHHREVIARAQPILLELATADRERIADHITDTVLAAAGHPEAAISRGIPAACPSPGRAEVETSDPA